MHPIIKKEGENFDEKQNSENILVYRQYSNVYCTDGKIVTIDMSNSNAIDTKLLDIICGNAPESLIYDGADYVDAFICMDSILLNNILSILRDGYVYYHEHIHTNINIIHVDGADELDINEQTEYIINYHKTVNKNTNRKIEHYHKKLYKYLVSYGVLSEYDFMQLNNRIKNYCGHIEYSGDDYWQKYRTNCSEIYHNIINGKDICGINCIYEFVCLLTQLNYIPAKTTKLYVRDKYSGCDIHGMIKNEKNEILKYILNYFYGFSP